VGVSDGVAKRRVRVPLRPNRKKNGLKVRWGEKVLGGSGFLRLKPLCE